MWLWAFLLTSRLLEATASLDATTNHGKISNNFTHQLECGMRSLAMDFARTIQSWRHPEDPMFRHIHDALRLTSLCGKVPPPSTAFSMATVRVLKEEEENEKPLLSSCSRHGVLCIFVSTNSSTAVRGDGSVDNPVGSLHKALNLSRTFRLHSETLLRSRRTGHAKLTTKIILRQGIHDLGFRPLVLSGELDSHIQIISYPNEDAWISGGIALPKNLTWTRWSRNQNVWVTDLSSLLQDNDVPDVTSLFTFGQDQHQRLIRARYPNGNPERDQWGHRSPDADTVAIPANVALEWHKPEPGPIPAFDYITLDGEDNGPRKNDSTMDGYNLYASGHGGVCAEQWGPQADSYWCSNFSQGGWAGVDREAATTGKLQIPVGVTWNVSTDAGQHLGRLNKEEARGGIVFAWHSQTWAMHMFQIANCSSRSSDKWSAPPRGINQFYFQKGGGKQGGRNWCRCDQCTYAGPWCGQHQNPPDHSDTRLIGRQWMVENLLPELDQPGEFWFNHSSQHLFVYPNTTEEEDSWKTKLRFATLENILELRNVRNVEVIGLGFRDSAATFMSDWSAPSGGDWSLHRGGAVFLENTTNVVIRDSLFRRLDSNAIFLSRRNRNTTIQRNTFEWLAENAIATWGDTDKYDATKGDQPWDTKIHDNVMRELGIYQKQSSGLGQAKASLSDVRRNIMFNLPRAAINFNDMVGGGDQVIHNLLFNTCRESGDHGPINSWDRIPYLTKLRDGKTPSFDPLPRAIFGNFIFANYGASQGVDNDDGSSWFHIKKNVFYDASGFKQDYGGHDSVYEENLSFAFHGKDCVGVGTFKPGHGDIVRNNRCVVGLDALGSTNESAASLDSLGGIGHCKESNLVLKNNTYHSPRGMAGYTCRDIGDDSVSLSELVAKYDLEVGSTCNKIPPVKTLIQWTREMLLAQHHLEPS